MLVPRINSAQRLLVNNPTIGLLVFDTDKGSFFFFNGTDLADLNSGEDAWTETGTNVHLADSTNKVGAGTSSPQNKFIVTKIQNPIKY
ncbi:MAG: hypothetical protein KJ607_13990 [Bacteroidetes bacterium]|nr:hypothetical protein [Bacteroidota bacterium]